VGGVSAKPARSTRYVALLRGVNVGKGNRVPMAELRALLETLGFTDVRTLLNSGNALFAGAKAPPSSHAGRIRVALAGKLGVDVPVIVKSAADIAAIEEGNGLLSIVSNPSRLLVAFTAEPKTLADLAALAPLVRAPERLLIGKHAAYLWCPNGSLESKAGAALLGKLGRAATTRNWATVLKIGALVNCPGHQP
jgi:uncharacterized protein (DUF1697 family)